MHIKKTESGSTKQTPAMPGRIKPSQATPTVLVELHHPGAEHQGMVPALSQQPRLRTTPIKKKRTPIADAKLTIEANITRPSQPRSSLAAPQRHGTERNLKHLVSHWWCCRHPLVPTLCTYSPHKEKNKKEKEEDGDREKRRWHTQLNMFESSSCLPNSILN